jgi:ferrochelatase
MKKQKNAIILVNLGSIESFKKKSVYKFLFQFLSDKRVVRLPSVLWYPILCLIIFLRASKLLKKYKEIAINEKIPLLQYTHALSEKLAVIRADDLVVDAYLYGVSGCSVSDVLKNINNKYFINSLTILPLYPQYSSTTVAPVFDLVSKFYKNQIYIPKMTFINEFAMKEVYIKTIVNSIRNFWQEYGKMSRIILVSFHSLPIKLIKSGDCYESQCYETCAMIRHELMSDEIDVVIGFQSKFGYEKWLQPSTEHVLREIANNGYQAVDVVAPGFVCDCLETLEEIAISYKQLFENLVSDGKLRYIPCLNDSDMCVEMLNNII